MSNEIDIRQRAWAKLRRHAHQLLARGYLRLNAAEFGSSKEPDITGRLCQAVDEFMAATDAPSWVTRYALRDDPKLNVRGLEGESRPRIDIEIERVQRGRRPLFRFEAKRLGPKHSLTSSKGYLGSEGIGAFLSNYYELTHPEAGMLGYIQSDNIAHWHQKLLNELAKDPVSHGYDKSQGLTEDILASGLSTWRSEHMKNDDSSLMIWHTLLLFH